MQTLQINGPDDILVGADVGDSVVGATVTKGVNCHGNTVGEEPAPPPVPLVGPSFGDDVGSLVTNGVNCQGNSVAASPPPEEPSDGSEPSSIGDDVGSTVTKGGYCHASSSPLPPPPEPVVDGGGAVVPDGDETGARVTMVKGGDGGGTAGTTTGAAVCSTGAVVCSLGSNKYFQKPYKALLFLPYQYCLSSQRCFFG